MNYEVQKQIGQGGFGIVEEAIGSDGERYALKTLNLKAFSPSEASTLKKKI